MDYKGVVVYISHYSDFLGANRSLFQIISNIPKYGYKPLVLVPNEGEFTEVLKKNGISYQIIKIYTPYYIKTTKIKTVYCVLRGFYMEFKNILSAYKIAKKYREECIKCVHTNSSVTNIGAYISRFMNVPHIWHVREFAYLHYGYLQPWGNRNQRRFMGKYSSLVLLVSESLKIYYSKDVDNNKLHVVYNGIDSPPGYDTTKIEGVVNIVTVGVIHPSKRQLDVLIAFKDVLSRANNRCLHLYVVGSCGGNSDYYNTLLKYVKDNCLDKYVTFTGYCDNVSSLLKDMHIGILASSYEAFGRVTVEYMLHNLVPIVSDSGANTELIDNKHTGYVFQNRSDLTNILFELINNPEKMHVISAKARSYALQKFTIERTISNIINCYNSIKKE